VLTFARPAAGIILVLGVAASFSFPVMGEKKKSGKKKSGKRNP